MTFEEYKKKRKKSVPGSVPLTIMFVLISVFSLLGAILLTIAEIHSKFDVATILYVVLLSTLAVYAALCASDGKKKTLQEALFDISWMLPF